jgi:hypothetical protein
MLKVEEFLSGVSLSRLFRDPAYASTVRTMTEQDVRSMIGQSIALQLYTQMHAHVIHRDVHAGNAIVSYLDKPCSFAYSCGHSRLDCEQSRFMVARFDWSEAVPYASLDALTANTEIAFAAFRLGYHARQSSVAEPIKSRLL